MRTFDKFMGRYPELASKVKKSPSSTIYDSVPMAELAFPELHKFGVILTVWTSVHLGLG